MIPERIYVAGFLCYREPQELSFQGCSLWLLAGPNGSGKSALFDAILFALFAQHRGGRQQSRGLINESADRLVVEFDFQLDGRIYRARRTLARSGRSTRQLSVSRTGSGVEAQWETLADTHRESGYRAWIRDHLGLSYEAFTASVLLLQGRSDQILTTLPAERNDLLAQIVGLDRFRELALAARSRLSRLDGASDVLRKQLADIPKISSRQLEYTSRQTQRLREESQRLTSQLDQLREQILLSERLKQDQQRIHEVQRKRDVLRQVLLTAETVERDYERWNHLKKQLPVLTKFVEDKQRLEQLQSGIEQAKTEKRKLERNLAVASRKINEAEKRLDDALRQLEARAVASEAVAQSQAESTHAVESIERLLTALRRLCQVEKLTAADREGVAEARREREQLRENAPSDDRIQHTRLAQMRAAEAAVRAHVLLRQARERLQRFSSVSNEEKCSYCQQPLPSDLTEDVSARLRSDARNAERAAHEATCMLSDMDRRLSDLEQHQKESSRRVYELDGMIDAYEMRRPRTRELHKGVEHNYEVGLRELPASIRERVRHEGSAKDTAERLLGAVLEEETRRQQELQGRASDLKCELESLNRHSKEVKTSLTRAITKRSTLQTELETVLRQLARDEGELGSCEEVVATRQRDLSAPWRDLSAAELTEKIALLTTELNSLDTAAIRNQWETLCQARADDLRLSVQQETLDNSTHDSPSGDLLNLDHLSRDCEACQANLRSCNDKLRASEREQRNKQASHARYESLSSELGQTARMRELWKRLTDLLGRDRLQKCLMRNAEREIVDYANALLDRLSAGTIFLELRGDREEERKSTSVLDLLARVDSANGALLDVTFLSGSQRFRVAISLALAIGQYASHARRPIQAVIIDEGFGCLDATNRQVMIQELHNLRHHLERILLVSHQEEFTDAFSDGYVCTQVNGTTQVTSFHR